DFIIAVGLNQDRQERIRQLAACSGATVLQGLTPEGAEQAADLIAGQTWARPATRPPPPPVSPVGPAVVARRLTVTPRFTRPVAIPAWDFAEANLRLEYIQKDGLPTPNHGEKLSGTAWSIEVPADGLPLTVTGDNNLFWELKAAPAQ